VVSLSYFLLYASFEMGNLTMSPTTIAYGYLAMAIICEVIGTTFLAKSEQFTRLVPTLIMGVLYAISFYLLTQTLKTIPLGIAYALWGGLGIVLTSLVSVVVFKQSLDAAAVVGITMIVSGVVVMNLLSKSMVH
jgi:small multidrug resistance pump